MRWIKTFLSMLIIAFTLSGCENCEKGQEEPVQEKKRVDFHIDWIAGVDYIGYFIADDKGYYDEEKLDVNINFGDGAPLNAKLIGAKKIRIGTTTGDALIKAQHEKIPIIAVAVIFPKNPVVLISPSSSPITKIEQLRGKRLGMHETSITYKQYKALAEKAGIKPEEVTNHDVGWGGAEFLLRGDIDALLAYKTDKPVELEFRNFQYYELAFEDHGLKIIGQVIAVHPDTVANDVPEWVNGFVRASVKGWEFARNNPDEAVKIFANRFVEQNKDKCHIGLQKTLSLLPETPMEYTHPAKGLWQRTEDNVSGIYNLNPRDPATPLVFKPADIN